MSAWAWWLCATWLAGALGVAVWRGRRALREGRARGALRRVKSPTVWMFAAYLLVAAFVTPMSAGESTSPLLWLAAAMPIAYAMSAFAAAADDKPSLPVRLVLALLFGGAVLAAAAIILALVSPAFVPRWLQR